MAATRESTAGGALVLVTLASGQFLMTLDMSVMNVAIATVAKDVDTTVTGIQTAITLYTLVMAALMITGGKIGTMIGRRRGLHDRWRDLRRGLVRDRDRAQPAGADPGVVVSGRRRRCPDHAGDRGAGSRKLRSGRAPTAYGLVAAAGAIAVAIGPLLGGLATEYFSWRWVFIGEVAIVLVIAGFGAEAG